MHVVVQVVVSLLTELDLLEVDLDTNVAHIDVLEGEVFLQTIGTLVCDITESVQKFLGPVLEQGNLWHQGFALVSQELLERLALFDLKEVLVVVDI